MTQKIHGKEYWLNDDSFPIIHDPSLSPLKVRKDLPEIDMDISFLRKAAGLFANPTLDVASNGRCCGYIPINLADSFEKIYMKIMPKYESNARTNISHHLAENAVTMTEPDQKCSVSWIESGFTGSQYVLESDLILSYDELYLPTHRTYPYNGRYVCVSNVLVPEFNRMFDYYIRDECLCYDNLVNMLIMVKNGGKNFGNILRKNIPFIDRWTILDTGSTDFTVQTIRDVLGHIPGNLYEEPFINFKESRNRLLELAGKDCVFNIMLDDTYVLEGELLRPFLHQMRSDDVAESFSLYINGADMRYSSNRITKPRLGLRYKYKIHEIIEENYNVSIPLKYGHINDIVDDYMSVRTTDRKDQDIVWLLEEIADNPDDPRCYYYVAESYLNKKEYQLSYDWYVKRYKHHVRGYLEEKFDAALKAGVLAQEYLNMPWQVSFAHYLDAYEIDSVRPESFYQLGTLFQKSHSKIALQFFKIAFDKGIELPPNYTMNIRHDMYRYHLPKAMLPLCYEQKDFVLGEQAAKRIHDFKQEPLINHWYDIFYLNNQYKEILMSGVVRQPFLPKGGKETVAFLMHGGWSDWYGKTLREKGLGGSETFIVRFAEYLTRYYNVVVFCKCGEEILRWNDVYYYPIGKYTSFLASFELKVVFVNRYPVYVPVTIENNVPTYLILHDLISPDEIIVKNEYFKGIICLTDWHIGYVKQYYPMFSDCYHKLSYGIETSSFPPIEVKKHSFIFPSFPNRGLVHLLRMFPRILERYPDAVLNVFIMYDLPWLKDNHGPVMEQVKELVESMPGSVVNHGWVNSQTIREFWSSAHVWLYPCDFLETCCLTGFEAAASKTLAITTDLAALNETVGDRGVMIPGDPSSQQWQDEAFRVVCSYFDGELEGADELVRRNYEWAEKKDYPIVVEDFKNKFIEN